MRTPGRGGDARGSNTQEGPNLVSLACPAHATQSTGPLLISPFQSRNAYNFGLAESNTHANFTACRFRRRVGSQPLHRGRGGGGSHQNHGRAVIRGPTTVVRNGHVQLGFHPWDFSEIYTRLILLGILPDPIPVCRTAPGHLAPHGAFCPGIGLCGLIQSRLSGVSARGQCGSRGRIGWDLGPG